MAQEIVRAALLGPGAWGRVLATAAADSEKMRITHCWGRDASKRDAFAHEFKLEACAELDEIFGNRDIDAVLITLSNELHYPFARRAAEANKHIYLEKPIADTLPNALRVADLAHEHDVRICVGHCARLLAGNRALREFADSGELGRVNRIDAVYANDRGLRLTPNDWRWYQASAPGGPLSQIAIHQFDTLRYLGGEIDSVSALAARRSPAGAEVEDEWEVNVRFASGALGHVSSSWTSPGIYRVQVVGDAGLAVYEVNQRLWGHADQLHVGASLYRQGRGQSPAERVPLEILPGNMFREELEQFVQAIVDGGDLELSAENGCEALAIVYAAIESANEGGRLVQPAQLLKRARDAIGSARVVV